MNIEELRIYCISKLGVTESFPFNETALVFKVGNKIFAIVDIDKKDFINLKNDPEKNIELRGSFEGIKPGWHMNKEHWNSVYFNSDVNTKLLKELIDVSYDLINATLSKKVKENLN